MILLSSRISYVEMNNGKNRLAPSFHFRKEIANFVCSFQRLSSVVALKGCNLLGIQAVKDTHTLQTLQTKHTQQDEQRMV